MLDRLTVDATPEAVARYEEALAEAQARLKQVKAAQAELTKAQQRVTYLHPTQYHWSHRNGCGWEYESWTKPGYAQDCYRKQAESILAKLPLAVVTEGLEPVKEAGRG